MNFKLYYPSTRSKPNIIEVDDYGLRVRYVAEFCNESDAVLFLDAISRTEAAERENSELRAKLEQAQKFMPSVLEQLNEDIGYIGDDHSVGICCCDIIHLSDTVSEWIKKSQS